MKDRDLKKAMADSFKSGSLKIIETDDEGNEIEEEDEPSFCDTCGKEIEEVLEAFSYHMINDPDAVSVHEKLFCCRRCWNEYMIKEVKKIKRGPS